MKGELARALQDVAVITHAHDGYCIKRHGGRASGRDGRSPVEITPEVGGATRPGVGRL